MESQVPNPFTQVASQGYGEFAPTLDENDDDEETNLVQHDEEPDGPESPVADEQETNEFGFTQTQERSYPTGAESPDEVNDQEEEEAGPSSPVAAEEEEESNDDIELKESQHQPRRRVQIMDDSDNEDTERSEPVTSNVPKERNRDFLKQFAMKNDESPSKKHKKRRSDEHRHEKKSKRFRKTSTEDNDDTAVVEASSDVEDVVENIFGKDIMNENEEEVDDRQEVAAELAALNDEEAQEEVEEEETEQQQTYDADEDESEPTKNDDFVEPNDTVYDIDVYLEKKAERRRGKRRRGGKNGDVDLDRDDDALVRKLIDQMKIATEEDRLFNKSRQPATAKLLLLPLVEQHLYRADLTETFLESGLLTVMKDWLSPLPDKSLPNIKIREAFINILQRFGVIAADLLRDSGIGKALMYLYKHPRETRTNKFKLIKIIHDWARPIFHLDTDYKHLTREEREQRDVDQATLKRQTSATRTPKNRSADVDLPFTNDRQQDDDEANTDDADCPRARVPRPSNKDYVVRPVSTVEYSDKKDDSKKKTVSRLDEIKRRQQDRKRQGRPMSIVKLSIEGNKMHL